MSKAKHHWEDYEIQNSDGSWTTVASLIATQVAAAEARERAKIKAWASKWEEDYKTVSGKSVSGVRTTRLIKLLDSNPQ